MNDNKFYACTNDYDPFTAKLADPDLVNVYKAMDRRVIWLNDEVDENIMANVRQVNQWVYEDRDKKPEERMPIKIVLANYGGSMDYCCMMVDVIELAINAGTPVYTINLMMAASAGSYIFLAGSKRYMTKRAQVVIHEGSAQLSGDAEKVKAANDNYKKQLESWITYVNERTEGKLTSAFLKKHRGDDLYYDLKDALDKGIATDVVTSLNDLM